MHVRCYNNNTECSSIDDSNCGSVWAPIIILDVIKVIISHVVTMLILSIVDIIILNLAPSMLQ